MTSSSKSLDLCIITRKIGFNDGQGRVNYEIAAEAVRCGLTLATLCEEVDDTLARSSLVHVMLQSRFSWVPSRLLADQVFVWRTARMLGNTPAIRKVLANGFCSWGKSDLNAVHFVHSSWRVSPSHPWKQRKTLRTFYALLYTALNAFLERGAMRRSKHVAAVSNKVREELIQIGVPAGKISVIHNGVNCDEFKPGPQQRARFGLPPDAVIGLFAGDLKTNRKNLDTVLRAMVRTPKLHLAVAGVHAGTEWPGLAAQLGVADRVHFLGFQRDMPDLMRSVDLFVFPSRYEACSLVLLEAMASGLPVFTAESAGGAELVTPDVGVVLRDCNDDAGLAAALHTVLDDDARRLAMAQAARTLALRHNWQNMASRYLQMLGFNG